MEVAGVGLVLAAVPVDVVMLDAAASSCSERASVVADQGQFAVF